MPLLEVKNLKKVYMTRFGGNHVQALTDVSFSVDAGEYVSIMGNPARKTTLLNILAALDKPTSGDVLLSGKDMTKIKDKDIAAFRRDNIALYSRTLTFWIILDQGQYFPAFSVGGKDYKEMEQRIKT